MIKVAVVHYHLRRGGVTRVIENALTALSSAKVQSVVLSGEAYSSAEIAGVPVKVVPSLGYGKDDCDGEALAKHLLSAAREYFGSEPDLWHFHNHNLGKNAALTAAALWLAQHGKKLLLQIHDFAEDGRPALYQKLQNYFAPKGGMAATYPRSKFVHYAVLNERDHEALQDVGIPDVYLLTNPVNLGDKEDVVPPSQNSSRSLFLYPTRAIRRKNIGEFLLWAALAQEGERFAVTLAPENPAEVPGYKKWVAFAEERQLPVDFAVGLQSGNTLPRLMADATAIVTTSIGEGFGLAFLEPYLFARPVLGRDLPLITSAFKAEGIKLPDLYPQLPIPKVLLGNDEDLVARFCRGYETLLALYGYSLDKARQVALISATLQGEGVDFARLDEELQRKVIVTLQERTVSRADCWPVSSLAPSQAGAGSINQNAQIVREKFGLASYGEKLLSIYGKILAASGGENPVFQTQQLVPRFLAPEDFSLLKVPITESQETRQ